MSSTPSCLLALEGLPGSGKSTFAQALAAAFCRAGASVRWYSELEVGHPLAIGYSSERYGCVEAHLAEAQRAWHDFVRDPEHAERVVIVDAWLLQDPVFSLLSEDVAAADIVRGMERLFAELPTSSTTLVELVQRDVSRAVHGFCRSRGERMRAFYVARNDGSAFARARGISGIDGLVRFWSEHRAICDAVLQRAPFRRITIDVSDRDWPAASTALSDALGVPWPAPPRLELEQFCGAYALDDRGGTFDVALDAEGLVLRRFPFFWREVDTELIALGDGRFWVRSWPAEVHFDVRDGAVRSLVVSELRRAGQPPWPSGTYPKLKG